MPRRNVNAAARPEPPSWSATALGRLLSGSTTCGADPCTVNGERSPSEGTRTALNSHPISEPEGSRLAAHGTH